MRREHLVKIVHFMEQESWIFFQVSLNTDFNCLFEKNSSPFISLDDTAAAWSGFEKIKVPSGNLLTRRRRDISSRVFIFRIFFSRNHPPRLS